MKILLTILVSVLAALGARRLVGGRKPPSASPTTDLQAMQAGIQELMAENQRLSLAIDRRASALVAAQAQEHEIDEGDIRAALERWRGAHPAESAAAGGKARPVQPATRSRAGELDLAAVPMPELVRVLSGEGLTNLERQQLFQKLREVGRIDEYVAAIEQLAAADPTDPDLEVALGHAYLQKLFGVGHTPEAGEWAMKSDAAFDRALELDDQNWAARFSKAVSLSNWPPFLGRGPEAIAHFERLLEQQATLPRRDEFALTYLFLGNMQQASGEREKAIATWKAGLGVFPNMEELRRAVELAEASTAAERAANR